MQPYVSSFLSRDLENTIEEKTLVVLNHMICILDLALRDNDTAQTSNPSDSVSAPLHNRREI